MARAHIVVARNDLPDNFLQTLDLWPNSSLRNQAVMPPGQTHYNTNYARDAVNNDVVLAGAGPITVNGDAYGLSGYLVANLALPGNLILNAAQAVALADRIYGLVANGLPLTSVSLNALTQALHFADLDAGFSTGSVSDVLRILSGERWLLQSGLAVADGGPNFDAAVNGEFVNRPNVELPESVRDASNRPIRGRSSFGQVIPTTTAVQDTTIGSIEDLNFNDALVVLDTGALQQSAINGALSRMASPTFSWQNPAFTYDATTGTALDIGGNRIDGPSDTTPYQARAVTVYAADGSVIV